MHSNGKYSLQPLFFVSRRELRGGGVQIRIRHTVQSLHSRDIVQHFCEFRGLHEVFDMRSWENQNGAVHYNARCGVQGHAGELLRAVP